MGKSLSFASESLLAKEDVDDTRKGTQQDLLVLTQPGQGGGESLL